MSSARLLARSIATSLLARRNFSSARTSTVVPGAGESETSAGRGLNTFLINYALNNPSTTTFTTLFEQLKTKINLQLPHILSYENIGRQDITAPTDLIRGIVTIAHVIPSTHQVVFASGFAVFDGGLIVTCAHTFYQASHHLSSCEPNPTSQSIVITNDGTLVGIATVETHLPLADLVILRLLPGCKIPTLPIDPYPPPIATSLLSYELLSTSLSPANLPAVSFTWKPGEVLFYRDGCGHESEPGTYDELCSMVYSHAPSNGSSGGPIVNKETKSVVGIVRGSEINYSNRKLIGFAIPSESLFEAFQLPGMPDGVD